MTDREKAPIIQVTVGPRRWRRRPVPINLALHDTLTVTGEHGTYVVSYEPAHQVTHDMRGTP